MDKMRMDDINNNNEPIILGANMRSPKELHNGSNGPVITVQPPKRSCEIDATPMFMEKEQVQSEESNDESNITSPSLPTKEAWMPVDRDSDEYNMNHPRRGHAIIFNNEEFDSLSMKREGSKADVESLKEMFTYLGFDIAIHHNKCRDEIEEIIDQLAKEDHSDADCLFITVLSHGEGTRYIWARDDIYNADMLWTPFTADKCPTLAGKPKLFVIQACRGKGLDPGVKLSRKHRTKIETSSESHKIPPHTGFPSDFTSVEGLDAGGNLLSKESQTEMNSCSESYKIPTHADFLFAFCAPEGFSSFRHTVWGSWYIQSLCEEIKQNAHIHSLQKLLTIITRRVALDYESYDKCFPWKDKKKQVPAVTSTLIRDVYLRPKHSVPFKKAHFRRKKLPRVAHCLSNAFMSFYRAIWPCS